MLIKLDKFTQQNLEGFRKIIKKYVKKTSLSAAWYEHNERGTGRNVLFHASRNIHALIVQLSQYHQRVSMDNDASEPWVPPSVFSRTTTKYWVAPKDLVRLKLFLLHELPILEVSGPSAPVNLDFYRQTHTQVHNMISSVYLDNETCTTYHTRIQRLDGAQLFRLRWYGGAAPAADGAGVNDMPLPPAHGTVYLERKTHRDKKVSEGQPSTKERFPLAMSLVSAFLSGQISPERCFETMALTGHIKAGAGDKHLALAQACQQTIISQRLVPKVRTVYHRTAFQRSDSNQVRVSLDHPCHFVREDETRPRFWETLGDTPGCEPFPYGVLELKLCGEAPEWVDDLLRTGMLIRVDKFSKFLTSMVTHYSHAVEIMPYWIDSLSPVMDEEEPVLETGDEEIELAAAAAAEAAKTGEPASITASGSSSTTTTTTANATATTTTATEAAHASVNSGSAGIRMRKGKKNKGKGGGGGDGGSTGTGSTAPVTKGGSNNSNNDTKDKKKKVVKKTGGGGGGGGGGRSAQIALVKQPKRLKVEPKTFFANERTFIQWLSVSVFLITLSSAFMSLGGTARIAGTMFFPVAMLFIIYAFGVYRWRLKKINAGDSSGRFDDPYGPWIFTLVLSAVTVGVAALAWSTAGDPPTQTAALDMRGLGTKPPLWLAEAYESSCGGDSNAEKIWSTAAASSDNNTSKAVWRLTRTVPRGQLRDARSVNDWRRVSERRLEAAWPTVAMPDVWARTVWSWTSGATVYPASGRAELAVSSSDFAVGDLSPPPTSSGELDSGDGGSATGVSDDIPITQHTFTAACGAGNASAGYSWPLTPPSAVDPEALLATPQSAVLALQAAVVNASTVYLAGVPSLGDEPAVLYETVFAYGMSTLFLDSATGTARALLTLAYSSQADAALLRAPLHASWTVELIASAGRPLSPGAAAAALRQGQALMETLSEPVPDTGVIVGAIVGSLIALFVVLFGALLWHSGHIQMPKSLLLWRSRRDRVPATATTPNAGEEETLNDASAAAASSLSQAKDVKNVTSAANAAAAAAAVPRGDYVVELGDVRTDSHLVAKAPAAVRNSHNTYV